MTKKKEKIVDLKPEKISDGELKTIQETINAINRGQMEMGTMEVRKHEILHGIAGFRDELTKIQSDLEKQYGTYDVDIQNGTINYPKENGEVNKED